MKKLYIIALFLMTGIMAEAQTSVWDGSRKLWTQGEGTESNPYRIESAENLAFLAYMVNKGFETENMYFILTTDIDLNGSEDQSWVPIGLGDRYFNEDGCDRGKAHTSFSVNNSFRGHFNGGGHNIYNLYIDNGDVGGLFGIVDSEYEIKNVNVVSGYIHVANYGGGIAGKCNFYVTISNCSNGADITGNQVGGIVGYGANKVSRCYNSGSIKGNSAAGGIAGIVCYEISECYNIGEIWSYGHGGGIIGTSQKNITVMNCYNTGNIAGNSQNNGGIAGKVMKGLVKNCYNVGDISNNQGATYGVLNSDFNGTADNLYYLNTCGGGGIGEPKTSDEMQDASFVDVLNNDTDAWGYDVNNANNGYPILENSPLSAHETTAKTMSVYPNPSNGRLTVEGTGLLTVTNLLGQRILEQVIKGQTAFSLPEGLYLLKLTDGDASTTRKVVVY